MAVPSNQPIYVLQEGTQRRRGGDAQSSNIMAARAVSDAIRTALGPKGMDKMLVDGMGDVTITNEGATILREVDLEHPAAKMFVEGAKAVETECHDGTKTTVVLAGELLAEAQKLLDQHVHAAVIVRGYQRASQHALTILRKLGDTVGPKDRTTLTQIARTAVGTKMSESDGEHLSKLAVEAVSKVADAEDAKRVVDLEHIKIEKIKGEDLTATRLVDGIVLRKERAAADMPEQVTKAKVLLLQGSLELKKTEYDQSIMIRGAGTFEKFLDRETKTLNAMADKIAQVGATAVFSMKGINELVAAHLARKGIVALKNVSKTELELLERATGATLLNRVDDATPKDLGAAGSVRVEKHWGDEYVFVEECPKAKAVTVLMRGGVEHVLEEAERNFMDALGVLKLAVEDGRIVAGAGAVDIELASAVRKFAHELTGRESLAAESFANALEVIPKAIAENAGHNAVDALLALRKAHAGGDKNAGFDISNGKTFDARKRGIVTPLRVPERAISTATELATMMLRIDDVIAAKGQAPAGAPPAGPMADY